MLFNSPLFIFIFLPLALIFFKLASYYGGKKIGILSIVFSSLVFYSYYNIKYLFLIIFSISFNYLLSLELANRNNKSKKNLLIIGITINLLIIIFFKYANFLFENFSSVYSIFFEKIFFDLKIVLPLAISFFTFQQIGYLIDVYKGAKPERSIINYSWFILFFPQLIAGPIVQHKEVLPQIKNRNSLRISYKGFGLGSSLFFVGLFKKLVIADQMALYSTPIFIKADSGELINFGEAWVGALCYSFQIYFDFSGYSDMALGIALLFGVSLPINFLSPYKAGSIIDFWKRWHITLSRFLKNYLYIPLGGNKTTRLRNFQNITLVMLLGGLWHGASWNFVIWGGVHGLLIVINHIWRKIVNIKKRSISYSFFCMVLTFTSVTICWVFFRAESLEGAISIIFSMFQPELNNQGIISFFLKTFGHHKEALIMCSILILWCWFLPNTFKIFIKRKRILPKVEKVLFDKLKFFDLSFRFNIPWAIFNAVIIVLCISYLNRVSEFIYFNF